MATITSSSTLQDAQAAYLGNCGYREERSLPMARAFCSACRAILLLMPSSISEGGDMQIGTQPGLIAAQLTTAESWIAQNTTGGRFERVVGGVGMNFRGNRQPGASPYGDRSYGDNW